MTHTTKQILIASAAALTVAAVVFVSAVLPAEFGVDPLGTGKAVGLLALYDADANAPRPVAPATDTSRPRAYRVDVRELALGPGQSFEFKYRLVQGAGMVYAWNTDRPVKYEFHGEPNDRALKVVSYEKAEGDYASGTLTAAFAGIHGWYFENPSSQPITIRMTSAGFFTSAEEFRSKFDPERHKDRVVQTTYDIPPQQ